MLCMRYACVRGHVISYAQFGIISPQDNVSRDL